MPVERWDSQSQPTATGTDFDGEQGDEQRAVSRRTPSGSRAPPDASVVSTGERTPSVALSRATITNPTPSQRIRDIGTEATEPGNKLFFVSRASWGRTKSGK